MIQAKAAPPIHTGAFDDVCYLVFQQFKKRGIPTPTDRLLSHSRRIAKAMTAMYGVYMEFFSELGSVSALNLYLLTFL